MIRSRMLSVCYQYDFTRLLIFRKSANADGTNREKISIPANVIDQLISGAQSDIRQVLAMMAMWKLGTEKKMDFDQGKKL
jgi:hypothetical protein